MSATIPRFTKLDATDYPLPKTAIEWLAVLDSQTGLIWANESLKARNWDDAMKKASAYSKSGNEWRAPTRNELFSLTDVERRNPAIDTTFFQGTESDWHWSSSPVVGWPEGAWGVYFGSGYVGYYNRNFSGFVRPVRAARPRQFLAIGDLIHGEGGVS